MGERLIGDLLEELDKAYQERKITVGKLENERGIIKKDAAIETPVIHNL